MDKCTRARKTWYTIYNAKTDEVIAFGDYMQCCKTMGIKSSSFYSILKWTKNGRDKKYTFVVENLATGEYNVYGADNRGKGKRWKWIDKEEKMKILYDEGMSDTEIGNRLGFSVSTVNNWRKVRGLKRNYECGRPRKRMIG